ncbi:MFS general substrate transporter [Cystobasidium minutum MCA 4210]|uniref:MFS general substrate transporter n=1 Tax=Cystobasidium minutum MCA 4210 TaxID=1397322 RepID=UPI0034CE7061|eukprot:jgi/Rhomi1/3931/CE3930_191
MAVLNKNETGATSLEGGDPSIGEKPTAIPLEDSEDLQALAARGHVATDQYGRPLITFDPVAEKKLLRKIDLYVVPTVFLLYLFCFIDRANIGNAKLAGLEKDLGLKGYDYNILLTSFYISYVLFEIPSNLLCKIVGPGKWIPFISFMFGLLSLVTAFVKNRAQAAAVRFLLGIFEAGMLPGIAYYLSRWYRKKELAFRLALYLAAAPLAGAFGGLLASGILKINSIGSVHTWQQIFLIEGIITCGISIISFWTLTDRPATARWLNEEEKLLAIARVKSENVGSTTVLDKMDKTKVLRGIFSPATMAVSVIFLLDNITVQGLAFFLPTIVRTIYPGTSVVSQQLRTVPPYIVSLSTVLLFPYLSWKLDKRLIFFILSAPLMMAGYVMFLATTNGHVRYGATFLITSGAFSFGALTNAQVSANLLSDTSRSAGIGANVMMGNIGGLISTWAFLPFDGPNYPIGNGLNLATSTTILILCFALYFWQIYDNKRRDKRDINAELAGLTEKQIEDLDWKHPAHRWRM